MRFLRNCVINQDIDFIFSIEPFVIVVVNSLHPAVSSYFFIVRNRFVYQHVTQPLKINIALIVLKNIDQWLV